MGWYTNDSTGICTRGVRKVRIIVRSFNLFSKQNKKKHTKFNFNMSSINAVKTKMMRKDIIKICSLQKGDVWVPGARQSQNDVAKTSNCILTDDHTFSA